MKTLITSIYFIGLLGAPIAGFVLAARRPHASHLDMLGGATLGGALLGGLLASFSLALVPASGLPAAAGFHLTLMLYFITTSTAVGLAVGMCGLSARAFGAWLGKRR